VPADGANHVSNHTTDASPPFRPESSPAAEACDIRGLTQDVGLAEETGHPAAIGQVALRHPGPFIEQPSRDLEDL
jgi:hypothetical protein